MANQYAYEFCARVYVSSGGVQDVQILKNTTPGSFSCVRTGVGRVKFTPTGFELPAFVGVTACQNEGANGINTRYNDENMSDYIEVQSGNSSMANAEPACFTVNIIIPKG
jgi:hypothetical protein